MSYVPNTGNKTCRKCDESKSVLNFRIFKIYGSEDRIYRRCWCQDCERVYSKKWRDKHPGYHAMKSKNYRQI